MTSLAYPVRELPTSRIRVARRRALAYVADVALTVALGLPVVVAARLGPVPVPEAVVSIITVAISVSYFVWFWTRPGGSTPAMRYLHLELVDVGGDPRVSLARAIARIALLELVLDALTWLPDLAGGDLTGLAVLLPLAWWGLLILTTILDPRGRGIHDRAGHTMVRASGTPGRGRLVAALVATALAFIAILWISVATYQP
jgi:uncharacterized RDD family membrane protein YckC